MIRSISRSAGVLRPCHRWLSQEASDGGPTDAYYDQEASALLPSLFPKPKRPVPPAPPKAQEAEESGEKVKETLIPQPVSMPEIDGESDVDREIRAHNSSMYNLKGQGIVGRVVAVGHRDILVDLGWKDYQRFFKSELSLSQIYRHDSASSSASELEENTQEFQVGDELRFRIEDLGTPHGEIFVSTQKMRADIRKHLVWDELKEAFQKETKILGRVLNPCNAGYAVGVGGFVAFCPLTRMSPEIARRIGVLQSFVVQDISEQMGQNLVVADSSTRLVGRPIRGPGRGMRFPPMPQPF